MKILHIITGLGMGGAERVVLDLATLGKKQNNIFVISLSNNANALIPQFEAQGITPIICDLSHPLKFFSVVCLVIKFIKQKKIAIVHTHLFHPILMTPFIKVFTSARIVFTAHSFNIGSKLREISVFLLKPFRDADVLFSSSQMSFFYKKKHCVIANGVNIELYNLAVKKLDRFTFVTVGRLQAVKNHIALLVCMHKLIYTHNINCQLNIIGDGELRGLLEAKIVELNLASHVHLLGVRNDINVQMSQSHCLLMPSLWEGLPIVILEAGASCLPIISTPVGSIPTLLTNENAYLSEIENFEATMLDVVNNYPEAQNKAKKLYDKIIASYSLNAIIEQHLSLYNSLNNDLNITE